MMLKRSIALFILLFGIMTPCGSGSANPDEDALRSHYLHQIVTLRQFYSDNFLKYYANGQLISKSGTGSWTLDSKVEITGIKLNSNRLAIEGNRIWVFWKPEDNKPSTIHYSRSPQPFALNLR